MGRGSNHHVTKESYRRNWAAYQKKTDPELSPAELLWLEPILEYPRDAEILEIGSGTGRTSDYLDAKGFRVQRTDVSKGFVDLMNSEPLEKPAVLFDLMNPGNPGKYETIIANAVLLHFTKDEFSEALTNISDLLQPGGKLFYTLKRGQGERTIRDGELLRFFRFWEAEELDEFFGSEGWSNDSFETEDGLWINGVASKSIWP